MFLSFYSGKLWAGWYFNWVRKALDRTFDIEQAQEAARVVGGVGGVGGAGGAGDAGDAGGVGGVGDEPGPPVVPAPRGAAPSLSVGISSPPEASHVDPDGGDEGAANALLERMMAARGPVGGAAAPAGSAGAGAAPGAPIVGLGIHWG